MSDAYQHSFDHVKIVEADARAVECELRDKNWCNPNRRGSLPATAQAEHRLEAELCDQRRCVTTQAAAASFSPLELPESWSPVNHVVGRGHGAFFRGIGSERT